MSETDLLRGALVLLVLLVLAGTYFVCRAARVLKVMAEAWAFERATRHEGRSSYTKEEEDRARRLVDYVRKQEVRSYEPTGQRGYQPRGPRGYQPKSETPLDSMKLKPPKGGSDVRPRRAAAT